MWGLLYERGKGIFALTPHVQIYVSNRAHISGRQTPGSPPHICYIKEGVKPGLNLGFGVLKCGLVQLYTQIIFIEKKYPVPVQG
jgi:hypothetical protein